jgi:acetyl esterase/lipase
MLPPARAFRQAGYRAFVLEYTTSPLPLGWQPLVDGGQAIQFLRCHDAELGIDPRRIVVCGFSAGGHLAASTAILAHHPRIKEALVEGISSVPNAVVLCYPVVSGGEFGHKGSKENLCGADAELRQVFSLEEQVTSRLPPFFLWQALTDQDVPVENSLLLAQALRKNGVPFELHLFGSGGHGTSICTREVGVDDPHNAHWFPLCLEWLENELG